MSRFSVSSLDRYPLPLASVLAVAAALFMITVWAPIQQRGLSEAVGRPAVSSVPRFAAGVGITYRTAADGTFDHQSAFALLDESGHVLARTSNTQNPDPRFVAAVRRAL